jgi:tRNA(fMet)-specific endonuclease VapC
MPTSELRVGAAKSAKPLENRTSVDNFVMPFALLWPDEAVMDHYVAIRCALESKGKCIGEADLSIATTARARGDVVVTNNVDEFKRVPDLVIEDWTV